ncbi:hypothetical protein V6N13_014695 [Hibiscus sabdariffa]
MESDIARKKILTRSARKALELGKILWVQIIGNEEDVMEELVRLEDQNQFFVQIVTRLDLLGLEKGVSGLLYPMGEVYLENLSYTMSPDEGNIDDRRVVGLDSSNGFVEA